MKIITHPNPILRKQSTNVEAIDESVTKFVQDMIETLSSKDGLGLAAPQVGENLKIFPVISDFILSSRPLLHFLKVAVLNTQSNASIVSFLYFTLNMLKTAKTGSASKHKTI